MATVMHIKARITPWDDPAFVRAFENARQAAEDAGIPDTAEGPDVERRLHEYGYPRATVRVERTVEEALKHSSRWVVRRDG